MIIDSDQSISSRFADESTLQEVHRVLRPKQYLGMIWNIEDCTFNALKLIPLNQEKTLISQADNAPREWNPTTSYEAKLKEIIWSLSDTENRFRHNKWREVFERQGEKSADASDVAERRLFTYPLEETSVPFVANLPKDDVWNRMRSLSHIANSTAEEQEVSQEKGKGEREREKKKGERIKINHD